MTDTLDAYLSTLNDINANPAEIEKSINSIVELRNLTVHKKYLLSADRRNILIQGPTSAIQNNDNELDEISKKIERIGAIESELRIKLDRANETVRETEIRNKRELLIKEREAAADKFREVYGKNAIAIAACVANVALVDAKINRFNIENDELMDSCDAVARNFRLLPYEVINESDIENALVDTRTNMPVDADKFKLINRENDPRCGVYVPVRGIAVPITMLTRDVKKIEYKEKVELIEQPIAKLLSLPPAYAGEDPYWCNTSRERLDKLSVEELEALVAKLAKAANSGREKKSPQMSDDREIKTKYVIKS